MPFPLLIALAAGGLSAVLFGSLLTRSLGSLFLGYFAALPVLAAGLWAGPVAAGAAAAAALAATAALGGLGFAATYLVAHGGPAVLLVRQALLSRSDSEGHTEWYPPGLLAAWPIGLAAAAFVTLAVVLEVTDEGLPAILRDYFAATIGSLARATGTTDESTVMVPELRSVIEPLVPGMAAVSWVVMLAINGALAQALLVWSRLNRRPSPDLGAFEVPAWMLPLLALAGLGAVAPGFAGFLGGNLVLILLPAFILAGLGVVHVLSRSWPLRPLFLAAVYVMAFFLGWPVVVLALIGVFEPWIRLRQRFPGPPRA